MSLNINNHPVEMLELILVDAGNEKNHRVMAAVCRQWRGIILAYRARHRMNGVIGNRGGSAVSGVVRTETDGHRMGVSNIAFVVCLLVCYLC